MTQEKDDLERVDCVAIQHTETCEIWSLPRPARHDKLIRTVYYHVGERVGAKYQVCYCNGDIDDMVMDTDGAYFRCLHECQLDDLDFDEDELHDDQIFDEAWWRDDDE